ncbi:MAG: hypothetical protein LBC02_09505 [Planctomycetaceae bacterium]|jgi:hypothetical protein|nr:hypothetical protein [Planctomycetaceae bacterium]
MAGGNEAQRSDRMKLLKNKVINSWIYVRYIRYKRYGVGLLHAVSTLPCLRLRLYRDCPKTEKNFFDYFFVWGGIDLFFSFARITKYIRFQFFNF